MLAERRAARAAAPRGSQGYREDTVYLPTSYVRVRTGGVSALVTPGTSDQKGYMQIQASFPAKRTRT